tara:strand:- start:706 stop:897 length:192 start_codon:yes stop_codon:yes gene_type:complete
MSTISRQSLETLLKLAKNAESTRAVNTAFDELTAVLDEIRADEERQQLSNTRWVLGLIFGLPR